MHLFHSKKTKTRKDHCCHGCLVNIKKGSLTYVECGSDAEHNPYRVHFCEQCQSSLDRLNERKIIEQFPALCTYGLAKGELRTIVRDYPEIFKEVKSEKPG